MSVRLVVFMYINSFIIYDIILTAFRIIFSTWLYNGSEKDQSYTIQIKSQQHQSLN